MTKMATSTIHRTLFPIFFSLYSSNLLLCLMGVLPCFMHYFLSFWRELLEGRVYCFKMTKITLNKVSCLAQDFIPSNLTVKLDRVAILQFAQKLDR